jgi:hypothetical protein
MQLTLAFLEPSPPPRQSPSQELDTETRGEVLNILARIIARACETTQHMEATGE